MAGKFLPDTNIVIAFFAQEPGVQRRFAEATEIFLSTMVLGELYFGAENSTRTEANRKRIDEFADANAILPCDRETAKHYGAIKRALKKKARPIPENDMWIAATAKQYDLTVATRDDHFKEIDGLSIERW